MIVTVLRQGVALACFGLAFLGLTIPVEPVPINVRWHPEVSDAERATHEAGFSLRSGRPLGDTTWRYELYDYSPENIAAIVRHPRVADTHHVDRSAFTPDDAPIGRVVRVIVSAAVFSGVSVMLIAGLRRAMSLRRFWVAAAAVAAAFVLGRALPSEAPDRWLAAAPWLPVVCALLVPVTVAIDRRVALAPRSLAAVLIVAPLALLAAAVLLLIALSTR